MNAPISSTIALNVENNTTLPQRVNILGGTQDPFSVPPKKIYEFDLTGETYVGNVNVSIAISNTSNPTPVTYTVKVNGDNIQAVAIALNTLNQGFFQTSGNTLYVSNDYYIYGALSLNSAFVSLWNTSNTFGGSSASNQIQLPLLASGTYNFVVNWGDGSEDTITSYNQAETLHTYAVAGIYNLQIVGVIDDWSFVFAVLNDGKKILNISNWGSFRFGINNNSTFRSCSNLTLSSVIGTLDLSLTNSLSNAFFGCTSLNIINGINAWNTSNVQSMGGMFNSCTNFNSNISNWNVINVTTMGGMFQNATTFNQNIGTWNVSNVTNMTSMFSSAIAFNQNIGTWNVSNVITMATMFGSTIAFNQNIGGWNVSNVTNMQGMFINAIGFNQNIGSWNISNVANFIDFMRGKSATNYSSANLNAIYNTWSTLTVQPNLAIDFDSIKYTVAGQAGKNILDFAPNNWTIQDGGI